MKLQKNIQREWREAHVYIDGNQTQNQQQITHQRMDNM